MDSHHMHSSLVLVTPIGMAPARFSRATGAESTVASTPFLEIRPEVKGMPARRETSPDERDDRAASECRARATGDVIERLGAPSG